MVQYHPRFTIMSADQPNLSRLEEVFGFEDPAFNRYINLHNTRDISAGQLGLIGAEMADSQHPIVTFAGGWALAESALYKHHKKSSIPLDERLHNLRKAREVWSDASRDLGQMSRDCPDLQESAQFFGFQMRALFAIACLPSFMQTAKWVTGEPVNPAVTATTVSQTRQRVLELGSTLAWSPRYDSEYGRTRFGTAAELSAAALLQQGSQLVLPGSIRQDHHVAKSERADLITVSSNSTHAKTRIQISSVSETLERGANSKAMLYVDTRRDLVLYPDGSPVDTLMALILREENGIDAATEAQLAELSNNLLSRLTAFEMARDQRTLAALQKQQKIESLRSQAVDVAREE